MEIVSLHPITDEMVRDYAANLDPSVLSRAASGSVRAANQVTFGLAQWSAERGPSFASQPFGLSFWEAVVDRSFGMLMRPPARLFGNARFDRRVAHAMPIRLEAQAGTMGGSWIPARLIPAALQEFDEHLERSAKRLLEADLDALLALELMRTSLAYASEAQTGLFEAQDLIVPGAPGLDQPVVGPDPARLPPEIMARIDLVITPPKKPSLFDRLFRRVEVPPPAPTNGHVSDVTVVERHEH